MMLTMSRGEILASPTHVLVEQETFKVKCKVAPTKGRSILHLSSGSALELSPDHCLFWPGFCRFGYKSRADD